MNKKNIIAEIQKDYKGVVSNDDVENIINAFIDKIRETLNDGEEVNITNFGKFIIVRRKPFIGTDLLSGEAIVVEETKRINFKVSKNIFRDI